MDDARHEPGMPVLDRQAAPAAAAGATETPRSVPEARPTPLQKHYVLLSAPALVLGTVAITALEMGAALGSPLVKLCVVVAAPLLAVANADAIVRIWRSAWAWMPVDRGRGLFRLAWTLAGVILYVLLVAAAWIVVTA
ncbi:MAG: hypothetical protein P4L30_05325 [Candidatus Limnocylindrales bacterium]|jgi:hypothetical protein|nr:hypothetical protein [Candidatus Limnocylindrales bacterium]